MEKMTTIKYPMIALGIYCLKNYFSKYIQSIF